MTNELRPGLPPLPQKMHRLPIDKRGFPVPFFVAIVNGEPDHRIVEPRAMMHCIEQGLCWICGGQLSVYKSFVIGPMCAINRINSEPPSHRDCARYAVEACPFMARPHAKRREAGMPDQSLSQPAGIHLERNPGVALIWTTRSFKPFSAPGGVLFDLGPAESMEWYAEGRAATRAEVDASIASGLPSLVQMAKEDNDVNGMRILNQRVSELLASLDHQFRPPADLA